jgi:sec-independent protein translocase protein TatC
MALRLETSPNDPGDKKAELTEHLAELRTRIIRSCLYIAAGMILMYVFSGPVQAWLSVPIHEAIQRLSQRPGADGLPAGLIKYDNFWEPFFLALQIAMVGGLIVAAPFVSLELWGFIAPALTTTEKRAVLFVAPMSVVLFILGVSCAYLVLPFAMHWFLTYLPPNAILMQNPLSYIIFVVKMLLVFGLLFELPVVLMFLGKIGILSSAFMIKYWRHIAVGLFTGAMVVAPSNDPGTMLALAVPLTLLFFASIGLVKLVEPKDPKV